MKKRIISFLLTLVLILSVGPFASATSSRPNVTRLAGNNRYDTAFAAANELKEKLGIAKFNAVIVSSGENFADALAGSYLAAMKDAPIILVRNNNNTLNSVKNYIKANLASGGTVYLLGGENAVPKAMETGLEGFLIKRLGGATRYETNLLILKEAGIGNKDIIVCTGKSFADSLSASAVGLPILLVTDSLNTAQKEFLQGTGGKKYIIGGTAAVNASIETALKSYGSVTRLAGNTRYETSVLVAKTFFAAPTKAVVAYGENFPDGLSGGSLANTVGAPLILTKAGKEAAAAKYVSDNGITGGYALGGTAVLPDKTVEKIFPAGSPQQPAECTHAYDNNCDKDCNLCGAVRTPAEHIYDNACDKDCNVCGAVRTPAKHTYDNACDKDCNVCGAVRTPAEHVYENASDADCNVCGAKRDVAVNPINITDHPQDYYVFTGSADFKVVATGGDGNFRYQWQYKKDGMSDFADVTSALSWAKNYTTATLQIQNISTAEAKNNYQFRCVITDGVGTKSTSNAAKLIIKTALAISEHPKDVTGAAGDVVTFSVAATGGKAPYTYQWYMANMGATGTPAALDKSHYWCSGYTTDTLTATLYNTMLLKEHKIWCVVTDAEGTTVTSNVARPYGYPSITTQPQPATGALNGTASFSVEVSGGKAPYTYQWKVKLSGMRNYMDVKKNATGMDTANLTVNTNSMDVNKALFRCVITDANGKSITSQDAILKVVESAPSFTKQPQHNYMTDDKAGIATFEVAVTGGKAPYTYQWQELSYGGRGTTVEDIVGGMLGYNGYKTNTLAVDVNQNNAYNYRYRCVVTDSNGLSVTSDFAMVCKPLKITIQPSDTECSYNGKAEFSVAVTGGSNSYKYEWQYCNIAGNYVPVTELFENATGANTATVSIPIQNRNYFNLKFRCVITDSNGKKIASNYATVKEKLTVTSQHRDYWNSSGDLAKNQNELIVKVSGGSGDYTYTWYRKNVPTGQYMDEYSFTAMSETGNRLKYNSRNNYTVVIKCVVTDSAGATGEVTFWLRYSPY